MEEIEAELKIQLHPMTVPINSGKDFKGVYDLHQKSLVLFAAGTKANDEDVVAITDINDTILDAKIGEKDAATLREDVELIDGVYGPLNVADYLSGDVAPVFFGSAVNNFGVREMLETFIRIAPTPRIRHTTIRDYWNAHLFRGAHDCNICSAQICHYTLLKKQFCPYV